MYRYLIQKTTPQCERYLQQSLSSTEVSREDSEEVAVAGTHPYRYELENTSAKVMLTSKDCL